MQAIDNIPLANIQIGLTAVDWKDAIHQAASPLIHSKAILPGYVDSMIRGVEQLGPYIALMPGFALAHSAPSSDVLRTDISLGVFDTPIEFHSENDPIYVVMSLACKDRESHIQRLQGIAHKFLEAPDLVSRIRGCSSKNELFVLLNE